MKKPLAIILAAGVGRRFGEALSGQPKALLEVEGETLLVRLIRQLRQAGVEEIIVVAGFGIEAIRSAVDSRVQVLLNPDYERGAILSLYTAREFFGRDLLVMDADVFGPDEMLTRLVDSPKESCFLLDGRAALVPCTDRPTYTGVPEGSKLHRRLDRTIR